MPSKKKKYNARFPPARIKKIMQSDEDVGKVAQVVPVIISKSLELFVEHLLSTSAEVTRNRNARTLTPTHIKTSILQKPEFTFLREVVQSVTDVNSTGDDTGDLDATGEGHSGPVDFSLRGNPTVGPFHAPGRPPRTPTTPGVLNLSNNPTQLSSTSASPGPASASLGAPRRGRPRKRPLETIDTSGMVAVPLGGRGLGKSPKSASVTSVGAVPLPAAPPFPSLMTPGAINVTMPSTLPLMGAGGGLHGVPYSSSSPSPSSFEALSSVFALQHQQQQQQAVLLHQQQQQQQLLPRTSMLTSTHPSTSAYTATSSFSSNSSFHSRGLGLRQSSVPGAYDNGNEEEGEEEDEDDDETEEDEDDHGGDEEEEDEAEAVAANGPGDDGEEAERAIASLGLPGTGPHRASVLVANPLTQAPLISTAPSRDEDDDYDNI